jgi:NTP pyrophosphatase (non-canonical NTP hydrolase)
MNTSNEQAFQDKEDLKSLKDIGFNEEESKAILWDSLPNSMTHIWEMTREQIREKWPNADLSHLGMTLNDYQKFTDSTRSFPEKHAIVYPALGLSEEAGEVAGKVKKWLRGDTEKLDVDRVKKEMGDVLWYLASLATDLGITLEDVAQTNIEKLTKRKETGTLKGDGDDREIIPNINELRDFSGIHH